MISEHQPNSVGTHATSAAFSVTTDDARLWRWYACLMEDRRVACGRNGATWTVMVDGREFGNGPSFDEAMRSAHSMMRALTALNYR